MRWPASCAGRSGFITLAVTFSPCNQCQAMQQCCFPVRVKAYSITDCLWQGEPTQRAREQDRQSWTLQHAASPAPYSWSCLWDSSLWPEDEAHVKCRWQAPNPGAALLLLSTHLPGRPKSHQQQLEWFTLRRPPWELPPPTADWSSLPVTLLPALLCPCAQQHSPSPHLFLVTF